MSNNKLVVEVMNASNTWVDVTADAQSISVKGVGLSAARSNHAGIGRCDIMLRNTSRTYNPDVTGVASALLDGRRRVRVRGTGLSLGNCLQITHSGVANSAYFSQVVSLSSSIGDTWTLQWDARAQFDSQYNADKVYLALSGETQSATAFTYTNKWQTYTLTYTNSANNTSVEPRFVGQQSGGSNATLIEYRNVSLIKNGGANVLTNGNFAGGSPSPWAATNFVSPASSVALAVSSDSWIIFNGLIEKIAPAPFVNGGALTTAVTCVDFSAILQYQTVDLPLQKNQTSDQIAATLAGLLPTGTLNTTLPGKQFDAGRQTFQKAFDRYTKSKTTVRDALTDTCQSEFGRTWFDRDGTLRVTNRDYMGKRISTAVKLSLADGLPFDMKPARDVQTVINKSEITYTPRQVGGGLQSLAQIQNYVTIPPIQPGGIPGSVTVTLNYRDATGKVIGGDSVITPVPTTDYYVAEGPDGSGFNYTSFVVLATFTASASQATITFTSTAINPLYITFLQVRGLPVYTYDPVTITQSDSGSIATYQERAFVKDLPFSNDQNFASSLGNYYVTQYKTPFVEVGEVSADYEARLNNTDLLGLELMDVVNVSDTQTGISNLKHVVVGLGYEFDVSAIDYVKSVSLTLERLDQQTYWILNDATYGLLGQTTWAYI